MSGEVVLAGDDDQENEGGGSEGSIIEAQIINTILNSRSVSIINTNGLDSTYFPGYEEEFNFVMNHYKVHKKVPDITTFLNKYPDFPCFDIDEADAAMVYSIKEAKGYSLLAPTLREIDEQAKVDSIEALKSLKQKIEDILPQVSVIRFKPAFDLIAKADLRYQEYVRRLELQGQMGLTFGIKSFDDASGGVWNEDFLGIVGRPGQGKSWIMEYLLMQPWKIQNKRVLLFSLENPKEVVGFRFDTLLGHFSNFGLMTGQEVLAWDSGYPQLKTEDYKSFIDSLKSYNVPFEVMDAQDSLTGRFTIDEILEIADQKNPDIIAIDQLSLVGTSAKYHTIRESYIDITRNCRQYVNEKHKPIYLNCQAGREAAKAKRGKEEDTPELEHIAESDSVGQDATKIVSIHNQDGILKLSLKKNTLGKSGVRSIMAWDIDRGFLVPTEEQDMDSREGKF